MGQAAEQIIASVVLSERLAVTMDGAMRPIHIETSPPGGLPGACDARELAPKLEK